MLTGLTPPLERFLSRLTSRSLLDAEERSAILSLSAVPSRVAAGNRFVQRGDSARHVYIVADGLVGAFDLTLQGDRQITALHINGDLADPGSLALDEATGGLEAMTDSIIVAISRAELCALATRFPNVAVALWRDGAVDAGISARWLLNIGRKTARARLAHLVCEMACRYEQAGRTVGLHFELPMTQEHLADATAMTSVHLNRSLRSLREDGIIERRGKMIEILDWRALIAAADFDAAYLRIPSPAIH